MTQGEDRPPITRLPDIEPPKLDYGRPAGPSIAYSIAWAFAVAAMAFGMTAWGFNVYWLTTRSAVAGILGFVAALVSGVCVFIADVIVSPGPKPSWCNYAAVLSIGSVVFVAVLTIIQRQ